MLRGIATINLYAADHTEATKWYSQFLNIEPYFNVPGYSEFRLRDFQAELGATIFDSITPRGDSGFATAAVIDPFGHILGLMFNPHYLEMVEKKID